MNSAKEQHEVRVDVRSSGIESATVYASFYEGKSALEAEGYEIISLPVNSQLRIKKGTNAHISLNGNWTKEGVLYIPRKGNYLVRESPILASAEEATQTHEGGKEFYVDDRTVEKALEDSIKLPNEKTNIPTRKFNEDPLTVWAFQGEKNAQEYGDFLKDFGVNEAPLWVFDNKYVNEQNPPFARQMGFGRIGRFHIIFGAGTKNLRYIDDRVRGVKNI